MKVLFCNPIFFEYRLPFYKELIRLLDGQFYVMYSPVRYKMCKKEAFCERIGRELGENAIELRSDHLFDTHDMRWDEMSDIERGKRIPLTWGLHRAIGRIKPDLIVTEGYFQWTPMVLLYGLIHRVPVIMEYERTCWTERNAGFVRTVLRKLFNLGFAGFLVNGSETRRYLNTLGVADDRIFVAGMCADSDGLRVSVEKYRNGHKKEPREGLRFLFTGAIAERKGVTHLLDAWRTHIGRYPKDELVLVGDGNQMAECKALAEDMPSVRFVGRVPYDEIGNFYALADVYILPTIEDNWSLVIPEAMACGLPVATSIYNGCHAELIQDGVNGYVFDTFRHETIVDVLDKFHHADLVAMGAASLAMERPFNTENSARRAYEAFMKFDTLRG